MSPNTYDQNKMRYAHSPQDNSLQTPPSKQTAPLDSDIQNFDKEPSSYFLLKNPAIKAIEKYGYYKIHGGQNDIPYRKFEGKYGKECRPFKYFGQMSGDKMEGKGQLQFTDLNGEYVVCNFKDGRADGEGAIYFANGDYFKGTIIDNSMREGTLYLENGNKYEGTFIDNMYDGQGTFTFKDGRKYKGQFKQGRKSGKGTINWVNGSSYTGDWLNGHQEGHGVFTDAKGVKHEGEFKDGKMLKPIKK